MTSFGSRTALIVVDVQNDFADPKGSLYVKGGEHVVAFINERIAAARSAGSPVVFTQDWHPESTPHFQKDGGIWPVHCVGGTWGAQLHPDLDAGPDEIRIKKGVGGEDGYSGFTVADPKSGEKSPTDLEKILRRHEISEVVVVGLATDYCVKETVLDATGKGFRTTVLSEGIRPVDVRPGDGDKAIDEMKNSGAAIE